MSQRIALRHISFNRSFTPEYSFLGYFKALDKAFRARFVSCLVRAGELECRRKDAQLSRPMQPFPPEERRMEIRILAESPFRFSMASFGYPLLERQYKRFQAGRVGCNPAEPLLDKIAEDVERRMLLQSQ